MLYAQKGRLRTRQMISDLALVLWCLCWVFLGRAVYNLVNALRGPADQLNKAATGLNDRVQSISDDLPSFLRGPFGSLAGSADSVESAATNQADSITHVATLLGWGTALIPIIVAVLLAVHSRLRWNSRVKEATRFSQNSNYYELLARRAVMHQPLEELAKVSADPLQDLRDGNFRALALLELNHLGIDPAPAETTGESQLSKPPS